MSCVTNTMADITPWCRMDHICIPLYLNTLARIRQVFFYIIIDDIVFSISPSTNDAVK